MLEMDVWEASGHFVTFLEGVFRAALFAIYQLYIPVKSCLVIYGKNR